MPPDIARELKDMIVAHLPIHHARYSPRIFRSNLTPEQRSSKIWSEIFKDYSWISHAEQRGLTPILVGHDLYNLYYGPRKPSFLVLVVGDLPGTLQYEKPSVRECLQSHDYNEESCEAAFKSSNIVLSIWEPAGRNPVIDLDPRKLFSRKSVASAALVLGDPNLHKISRKDITGVKDKINFKNVEKLCAIKLYGKKQCWNQIFGHPDRPDELTFRYEID
jgi:hypothetical protein